jgi:hypothetical protein
MSYSINLISDIPTRVLKKCLLKKKKKQKQILTYLDFKNNS